MCFLSDAANAPASEPDELLLNEEMEILHPAAKRRKTCSLRAPLYTL